MVQNASGGKQAYRRNQRESEPTQWPTRVIDPI